MMLCRVIDDRMWEELKEVLLKPKGRYGKDDRLFMEAICWIIRTGAFWHDLPLEYGNWKTTYNRYHYWVHKDHFGEIFKLLKKRWRPRMAHD